MKKLVVLALLFSSLSLALQLKEHKATPWLNRYIVPARITEFDYRVQKANVKMIRDAIEMLDVRQGIGIPECFGIAPDHRHFYVGVSVYTKIMPKDETWRKDKLTEVVLNAALAIEPELDPKDISKYATATDLVTVNFRDIDGSQTKPYATYTNGVLTFY